VHFETRLGHCNANDLDGPKGETFGSLSLIADDRSVSPMRNDVTYITESSGPYGVNQNQTGSSSESQRSTSAVQAGDSVETPGKSLNGRLMITNSARVRL